MNRLIIVIIGLGLTLVLGISLTWPKYQDFRDLERRVGEKNLELRYKEEYFSELKKLSEELKDYTEALSKIDSALPSDFGLPSLFEFFQKNSSQSGLILKEITPVSTAPFQKTSEIQETNIALSLSGSYSSFKNFLSLLQKSARMIVIESINFSSPTEIKKPLSENFPFKLKVKVYSY